LERRRAHKRYHVLEVDGLKGLILAAGDGSRIRRVTYGAFPKELLPIGNVPTIRFPLESLRLADINSVIVVIASQTKHGIVDGLQSGRRWNMDICYVIQEKGEYLSAGLGSAILSAKRWLMNEDFVVALGDTIVCNLFGSNPMDCLKPLIDVHRRSNSIATVLTFPMKLDPRRFGVAKLKSIHQENGYLSGEVERLVEKPGEDAVADLQTDGYYYAIAGYYVFNPSIFDYIEKTAPDKKNEVQVTDSMQLAIQNGQKVSAVVHARRENGALLPLEYWDVGIPEDYRRANATLLNENIEKWMSSE
jgi:glucose-1-phosphate thymidylyltransferase